MRRMEWTDRIGRRVKLRDLHILLAVAQSGSMARAAAIGHELVARAGSWKNMPQNRASEPSRSSQPRPCHDWAINVGNGPCHYRGTAETLELAKQLVEQSWRGWCTWAGLKDADE